MTTPISLMVTCLSLLSHDAPVCLDKLDYPYICIEQKCSRIDDPDVAMTEEQYAEFLKDLYGYKEPK